MLEPYKFIVQAILLDKDEEGNIVGEQASSQAVLYGSRLSPLAEKFDAELIQGIERDTG